MLSFTLAHISIVWLRVKEPARERPYRAPWNVRIRGRDIPLSACLGALGTFAAWVSVVILHPEARTVGIPWMVLGLVGFVVYRRRQGLDLTSAAKIDRGERPPDFVALEYRSAVVPILAHELDTEVLFRASRLVGEGGAVDVLYLIEIPAQLSLDAGLEAEEAAGRELLEAASLTGRRYGAKTRTALVRTRHAGRTIVEEAQRTNAEVVYLGARHLPIGEGVLGAVGRYVLAARPCRVILATESRREGSGVEHRVHRVGVEVGAL